MDRQRLIPPLEENELPPGPSFLEQAELMGRGNSLLELRRDVLYRNGTCLNVRVKKAIVTVSCIIGHLWGEELPRGPVPADVMVVGKWPGDQEASARRNLTGPSGIMLSECLKEAGVTGDVQGGLYVTNLVKHPRADPSTDQVSSTQFKDWAPVLSDEIALVRPKLILALGAEAAKAVLGAKTAVKDAQCCYFERQVRGFGEHPAYAARVVVVTHPAAVVRSPEQRAFFMDGLRYFAGALQGKVQAKEAPVDHRVVFEEDELAQVVDMVIQRGGPSPLIVVDAEWHGEHQSENGAYLRTIQFSDQPRFGCCVVLRGQGGGPGFCPAISRAIPHLRRLLTSSPGREVRIAGHHLRADIPRIYHELDKELGLALMRQYEAAKSPEDMRTKGGHDTMLMAHAIRETGFAEGFKLEYVAQSLLGMKRWNVELEQWKHDYCLKRKIPQKHLEGYGECPDTVLHPYSVWDVDGPQRLLELFTRPGGLLDADEHGNSSWLPYWISMRAQQAWLEIEMTGLYTDRERGRALTETYHQAAVALLQELKVDAKWPAFNPGSHFDCRELLFGEQYAGRKDDRTRPQGAVSLYLTPVRTTGKPPKNWEKVVARNEQGLYTPSTDKEVLGILSTKHELVKKLRNWRFLRQVTTNSLRAPETDDDGLVVEGDDGEPLHLGGLLGAVRKDSRIYSHFFQTQETGRARSVRPNLMNCSKQRESDYQKILGEHYKHAVRSMFTATPVAEGEDPWLLVDFDLQGAELMMTAIQAADPVMIDHCRRNVLPEDDPNYYDIHSATAVRSFRLDCPPTRNGLKSVGQVSLRIAAKKIAFGVLYGRGIEALVRAVKEEGVEIKSEDAETIRCSLFETYQGLGSFFDAAHRRVLRPGSITNCFGRRRRFARTADKEVLAKMQREAANFNIQSAIADLVSRWMDKLYSYPGRFFSDGSPRYRLVLQLHDALMAECRASQLSWFCDVVIPSTLASIPVYRCDMDGKRLSAEPFHLSTSIDVQYRWGEPLTPELADKLHVPPDLI
jgi:uracil-DNA glycosylase family 4